MGLSHRKSHVNSCPQIFCISPPRRCSLLWTGFPPHIHDHSHTLFVFCITNMTLFSIFVFYNYQIVSSPPFNYRLTVKPFSCIIGVVFLFSKYVKCHKNDTIFVTKEICLNKPSDVMTTFKNSYWNSIIAILASVFLGDTFQFYSLQLFIFPVYFSCPPFEEKKNPYRLNGDAALCSKPTPTPSLHCAISLQKRWTLPPRRQCAPDDGNVWTAAACKVRS